MVVQAPAITGIGDETVSKSCHFLYTLNPIVFSFSTPRRYLQDYIHLSVASKKLEREPV